MKTAAVFIVLMLVSLVAAAQKQRSSSGDEPFQRCVKILNFGQVHEFDKPMKTDAIVALGLFGDERAVPILVEHLANEEDENVRFQTARALSWIKSPKAVPALEKALQDKSEHVRQV